MPFNVSLNNSATVSQKAVRSGRDSHRPLGVVCGIGARLWGDGLSRLRNGGRSLDGARPAGEDTGETVVRESPSSPIAALLVSLLPPIVAGVIISVTSPRGPAVIGWCLLALIGVVTVLRTARRDAEIARLVRGLAGQVEYQRQVIESLSSQDEATGAYKSQYLEGFLEREVERGRRHERAFTICLVGPDDWQQVVGTVGTTEANRMVHRAIVALGTSARMLDRLVDLGNGELLLLLPETGLDGAETVAARIQSQFAAEFPVPVRVGIAEFPRDGETSEALMHEARQAFEFGRLANLSVVGHSLFGAG